jgi:hypothetical protein
MGRFIGTEGQHISQKEKYAGSQAQLEQKIEMVGFEGIVFLMGVQCLNSFKELIRLCT